MVAITLEISRRPARVTVNQWWSSKLMLLPGEYNCMAAGPFQASDGDWSSPVFVCELSGGKVLQVPVEEVVFTDCIGGGGE